MVCHRQCRHALSLILVTSQKWQLPGVVQKCHIPLTVNSHGDNGFIQDNSRLNHFTSFGSHTSQAILTCIAGFYCMAMIFRLGQLAVLISYAYPMKNFHHVPRQTTKQIYDVRNNDPISQEDKMRNRLFIAFALALLGVSSAYANTNTGKEITTALIHARLAEKVGKLQEIHLHLHHVVNCLEGSKGVDFDAKAGNPCMGMGHGALNDYHGNKLNKEMLQSALENAQYGLMITHPKKAQDAAYLAAKDLVKAEDKGL